MAGEIRTGVVIAAEAQGFDEALQKILKVNESTLKGMKEQAKSYDEAQAKILGLEGQIGKLAKTQASLYESMSGIKDKSSAAYKALAESLKDVQGQSADLEGAVKNLEKAYAAEARAVKELNRAEEQLAKTEERRQQNAAREQEREDQKRSQAEQQGKWAFTQGFAQTATPWMAPLFLQRGPGFLRQAAGQMTGAAVRGGLQRAGAFGGAVLQAPFQGAQGLASMMGALPIPGAGILGGLMGTATGYAGRAMEWHRQRLEALPYIGGGLEMGQGRGTLDARTQSIQKQFNLEYNAAEKTAIRATSAARAWDKIGGAASLLPLNISGSLPENIDRLAGRGPGFRDANKRLRSAKLAEIEARKKYPLESLLAPVRKRAEVGLEAVRAERGQLNARYQEPYYAAQREGLQFGMAKDQALQAMTAIIRGGGGGGREMLSQGMLQTGFAAQTLFGIGPETSGAFLQAGRRGGIVGGPGRADQLMTQALADGLKLGLEGSELVDYMQSMAEGIQQWETTGIPIAPDAIKAMATSFSQAGISGTRAAQMARGAAGYIQNIGARGPQGGLDLMLLNKMGGYTGVGGAAEYERAVLQMEDLGGKLREGGVGAVGADKGLSDTMRSIMEMGGGGATGRFFLRSVLGKQMGIQMGQREIGLLEKQLTGGKLTPEEQKYVDAEAARRAEGEGRAGIVGTPGGLIKTAKGAVPGDLRSQAAIQNQQIAAGEQMIGIVNRMDKAAVDLVKAFANLAGDSGIIADLTKKFENFGEAIEKATGQRDVTFGDVWEAGKQALGLN
jgi:hypothetical protein